MSASVRATPEQATQQAAGKPAVAKPPRMKRLNVNLPEDAFDELQALARGSGRTLTEVVRTALGLVKIGIEEAAQGNRLVITSRNGEILREILIPR